nr:MAG TPA: hypothetical protein [Bacteriophage sp.]
MVSFSDLPFWFSPYLFKYIRLQFLEDIIT